MQANDTLISVKDQLGSGSGILKLPGELFKVLMSNHHPTLTIQLSLGVGHRNEYILLKSLGNSNAQPREWSWDSEVIWRLSLIGPKAEGVAKLGGEPTEGGHRLSANVWIVAIHSHLQVKTRKSDCMGGACWLRCLFSEQPAIIFAVLPSPKPVQGSLGHLIFFPSSATPTFTHHHSFTCCHLPEVYWDSSSTGNLPPHFQSFFFF